MEKNKLLTFILIFLSLGVFSQTVYTKIDKKDLPFSEECTCAYNAGKVKEGYSRMGIYHQFVNDTDDLFLFLEKDQEKDIYSWKKIQPTTDWSLSRDLFQYVNNSKRDSFFYTSKSGDYYHIFDTHFTDKYMVADNDKGLRLDKVREGTDYSKPAFLLKIKLNYRKRSELDKLIKVVDCFYFYVNPEK